MPGVVLRREAVRFDLPEEAEDARRVIAQLHSAIERAAEVHHFAKGMGMAAPQWESVEPRPWCVLLAVR
jgi:hypothetical protein